MKCPKCLKIDCEKINADGVVVDRCKSCGGIWFDGGELYSLVEKGKYYAEFFREPIEITANSIELPLKCPKCGVAMKKVKKLNIIIDVCPDCKSVWTDKGEFSQISDILRQS